MALHIIHDLASSSLGLGVVTNMLAPPSPLMPQQASLIGTGVPFVPVRTICMGSCLNHARSCPVAFFNFWSVLQVPHLLYQLSCAAFASSFFHNVTSLLYETSSLKKKLAALQCFIKGISFVCDMQLGFGGATVFENSYGSP